MCIEKLNKIIEESGFGIIGLRVMTGGETVSVGENLENSFVWDDGFCTDEQIEGTSALDLEYDGWEVEEDRLNKMQQAAKKYCILSDDEQIVVIGGCDGYEGTDEHEVVIFNAKCIFIFK